MRFIINFIFFGLLFYVIWLYFPEVFVTLTTWAGSIVDFFKNLFASIGQKIHSTPAAAPGTEKGFLIIPVLYAMYGESIKKLFR